GTRIENSARASRVPWRNGTAAAWNRRSPTEVAGSPAGCWWAAPRVTAPTAAMSPARASEAARRPGRVRLTAPTSGSEAHVERNVMRVRKEFQILVRVVESRHGGLDDGQRELHPESGGESLGVVI